MTVERRGAEAWKANTTEFERIVSVSQTLGRPRTAEWIAEETHVTEDDAEDYLEQLVSLGAVQKVQTGNTEVYQPDQKYQLFQDIRELESRFDEDEISEQIDLFQGKYQEFQEEYGFEEPEELREHAIEETDEDLLRAASRWETVKYKLEIREEIYQ